MAGTLPNTGHTQRPASEHSFDGYRKLPRDKKEGIKDPGIRREQALCLEPELSDCQTSSSLSCIRRKLAKRRMGCCLGRGGTLGGTGAGWQEWWQPSSEERYAGSLPVTKPCCMDWELPSEWGCNGAVVLHLHFRMNCSERVLSRGKWEVQCFCLAGTQELHRAN